MLIYKQLQPVHISTHTLTWSVTDSERQYIVNMLEFQLTRSRGAWPNLDSGSRSYGYFNSHAHVERDVVRNSIYPNDMIFQLTRSRGAWLLITQKPLNSCTFQLTRSRGAWHEHLSIGKFYMSFQLTRSRGAWRVFAIFVKFFTNFNSHAHVERDAIRNWKNQGVHHFNSHAHVERDANPRVTSIYNPISTHTLTWSVTIYHY